MDKKSKHFISWLQVHSEIFPKRTNNIFSLINGCLRDPFPQNQLSCTFEFFSISF